MRRSSWEWGFWFLSENFFLTVKTLSFFSLWSSEHFCVRLTGFTRRSKESKKDLYVSILCVSLYASSTHLMLISKYFKIPICVAQAHSHSGKSRSTSVEFKTDLIEKKGYFNLPVQKFPKSIFIFCSKNGYLSHEILNPHKKVCQ